MAVDIFLQTAIFGGEPLEVMDLDNPSGFEFVPEPVGQLFEKLQRDARTKSVGIDFNWTTPVSAGADKPDTPLTKNHPHDGETIEQHGRQTWTYTYKAGKCVHQKVQDPDLGLMEFDENGDEIAA